MAIRKIIMKVWFFIIPDTMKKIGRNGWIFQLHFYSKNNFQMSKKLPPKEVLLQVGLEVVSIGYFENPLNRVKNNFSFFSRVSLQTRAKVVRLYALIYETQINCLSIICLWLFHFLFPAFNIELITSAKEYFPKPD